MNKKTLTVTLTLERNQCAWCGSERPAEETAPCFICGMNAEEARDGVEAWAEHNKPCQFCGCEKRSGNNHFGSGVECSNCDDGYWMPDKEQE